MYSIGLSTNQLISPSRSSDPRKATSSELVLQGSQESSNSLLLAQTAPLEVLVYILGYLEQEDRLYARATCKSWRSAGYEHLINIVIDSRRQRSLEILEESQRQHSLEILENWKNQRLSVALSLTSAGITNKEILERLPVDLWALRLSSISTLLAGDIADALRRVTNLKVLKISIDWGKETVLEKALENFCATPAKLTMLQELEVSERALTTKAIQAIPSSFPNLQILKLKLLAKEDEKSAGTAEAFKAMLLGLPKLEELNLLVSELTREMIKEIPFSSPKLKILNISIVGPFLAEAFVSVLPQLPELVQLNVVGRSELNMVLETIHLPSPILQDLKKQMEEERKGPKSNALFRLKISFLRSKEEADAIFSKIGDRHYKITVPAGTKEWSSISSMLTLS